jgi:uncharacterized lipoprotein YehR (DUF1307 family)
MQFIRKMPLVLVAVVAALQLSGCGQAPKSQAKNEPARIERVAGSEPKVILTKEAAQRLDIKTEAVRADGATPKTTMPYAAVFYDLKGNTYVYTSPEPLTFVRKSVTVDTIKGDTAFLSGGLTSGTQVVTVGVAELYGVEFGIGK